MTDVATLKGFGTISGAAATKRVKVAERQKQCLELRRQGMSQAEIATHLGMTRQNVSVTISKALRNHCREASEELIELEVARLDVLLQGIWARASSGNTPDVYAALKIMERRSRLLGLDAPGRSVSVTTTLSDLKEMVDRVVSQKEKEDILCLEAVVIDIDE